MKDVLYMTDFLAHTYPAVFGQAKLCKYNGQHYCFDCHLGDERIIPARVLFNWDFRKHKVSMASREFLDSIENAVVLNVQEVNKALYMYIPELEKALVSSEGPTSSEMFQGPSDPLFLSVY